MGYMPDINSISGDMAKVRLGQAPYYNYVYLPGSSRLYNVESQKPRYIRNIRSFKDFYFGTLNNR